MRRDSRDDVESVQQHTHSGPINAHQVAINAHKMAINAPNMAQNGDLAINAHKNGSTNEAMAPRSRRDNLRVWFYTGVTVLSQLGSEGAAGTTSSVQHTCPLRALQTSSNCLFECLSINAQKIAPKTRQWLHDRGKIIYVYTYRCINTYDLGVWVYRSDGGEAVGERGGGRDDVERPGPRAQHFAVDQHRYLCVEDPMSVLRKCWGRCHGKEADLTSELRPVTPSSTQRTTSLAHCHARDTFAGTTSSVQGRVPSISPSISTDICVLRKRWGGCHGHEAATHLVPVTPSPTQCHARDTFATTLGAGEGTTSSVQGREPSISPLISADIYR